MTRQEQWGLWAGLAGWKQGTGACCHQKTQAQAECQKEKIQSEKLCRASLVLWAGHQDSQMDP